MYKGSRLICRNRLRKKSMKLQALLTAALLFIILTACSGEKAEPITDEAERNLNDEYRTVITDDAASEESSETAYTSEECIADYNSYDEFIEDIKNLLDIYESSDYDTFWDKADAFKCFDWLTTPIYQCFTHPNHFGYLEVDIDGDGVDELLLGINGLEENPDDVYIASMFTIRNGKVDAVFEDNLRVEYQLYEDGIIEENCFPPNNLASVEYYKYNAGKLEFIEGIYYGFTPFDDEHQLKYYYSDTVSQKRELTEKEYDELSDVLKNRYCKQEMQLQLHLFKDKQ